MRIDVITIFPELFEPFLGCSVVGRARERGLLDARLENLRDYAEGRHRIVDDTPYGGGPGMVMKPEPWFAALESLLAEGKGDEGGEESEEGEEGGRQVVLLTPRGELLRQETLEELSRLDHLVLLCGRYEGIDDRVRRRWATRELAIGEFVLGGGELAAQVIVEGVARLLPGALGDPESARRDSYSSGLLDHRHFTKPAAFAGLAVPEVLLSGDHERIRRWRLRDALEATLRRRPRLLEEVELDAEAEELLREICGQEDHPVRPGGDRTESTDGEDKDR